MRPAHVTSGTCWCEPRLHYRSPRTRREVWLHRYMPPDAVVAHLHAGLPDTISSAALVNACALADDCDEDTWLELG